MLAPTSRASDVRRGVADGATVIRGKAGDSELVITTTARLAGAIHSLTWGGREFIDSADHGRQLQSALNLDAGQTIHDETYNPTEAGSRRDGAGPRSSSRVLSMEADDRSFDAETQMAFWLAPGEKSGAFPAYNTTVLSEYRLRRHVQIGLPGLPHAIDYAVTFRLPPSEVSKRVVFEVLTGYMPPGFDTFWGLDPKAPAGRVKLRTFMGEQALPIVLATASGSHAMGVIARPPFPTGGAGPTYGQFRFPRERVNKWNCVYRMNDPNGLKPGDYAFHLVVAVGTLDDVCRTLAALAAGRGQG